MVLVRPNPLRPVSADEPASPTALLQRVASGDRGAFAQLYEELGGQVYGIIRRVLVDPAMAEEVAQEVFVEVWQHAARFDAGRGSARSWVATIAHRRAVDRIRSETARRRREDTDHETTPTVVEDSVGDLVTGNADRDRVHAALARLPDAQREAVMLAYFGGRTYREVATQLGLPEGTAKTRIRDGLIRLRDMLGNQS